ncbi:MAG: monovalent cation/H(+) antiporter subunit G, partial [Thermoplasmatales archaeon]|nr:monovalent cation/H(+) antiporter subunit G [Thermoplasmatales archaeon]
MIFELIIYTLLAIGVFFNLLAGIGLLRFPDVYTR